MVNISLKIYIYQDVAQKGGYDGTLKSLDDKIQGIKNGALNDSVIGLNKLAPEAIDYIGSSGNIVNNADNEDLKKTIELGVDVLKFADKNYNKSIFSGFGRKYLRKNFTSVMNLLSQMDIPHANTIYIIQYDYDLDGKTIIVPSNCIFDFKGGSLSNGTIDSEDGRLLFMNPRFGENIKLRDTSSLANNRINICNLYPEKFNNVDGYITGLPNAIKTLIESIKYSPISLMSGIEIFVPVGKYIVDETINIPRNISLTGSTRTNLYLKLSDGQVGVALDKDLQFDSGGNTWQGFGIGRAYLKDLTFNSYPGYENKATGITDTRGAHHVENIIFGSDLKFNFIATPSYSSLFELYGDSRRLKHIVCSDYGSNYDKYKVFVGYGDAQVIDGFYGGSLLVVGSTGISIKNVIASEVTLYNCRGASIVNFHSEKEGLMIYGSVATITSSYIGNKSSSRSDYTNNIEVDTYRIFERIKASGIIPITDNNGNSLVGYQVTNRSIITVLNCMFLGHGLTFNNPTSNFEGYNIYIDSNGGTVSIHDSYMTYSYTSEQTNGFRSVPTCNIPAKTNYDLASMNVDRLSFLANPQISILSVNRQSAKAHDGSISDITNGTYYYKVLYLIDVSKKLGVESSEVSFVVTDKDVPSVSISYNHGIGTKILLLRGHTSGVYDKYAIWESMGQVGPSYNENGTLRYANTLLWIDSNNYIAGVRWKSNTETYSLIKSNEAVRTSPISIHFIALEMYTSFNSRWFPFMDTFSYNGNNYKVLYGNPIRNHRYKGGTSEMPVLSNHISDIGYQYYNTQSKKIGVWNGDSMDLLAMTISGVWEVATNVVLTAAEASYDKTGMQIALSGEFSFSTNDTDVDVILPYAPDYGADIVSGNLLFKIVKNSTKAKVRNSVVGKQSFQINYKSK